MVLLYQKHKDNMFVNFTDQIHEIRIWSVKYTIMEKVQNVSLEFDNISL